MGQLIARSGKLTPLTESSALRLAAQQRVPLGHQLGWRERHWQQDARGCRGLRLRYGYEEGSGA